jgi:hypothetical protein
MKLEIPNKRAYIYIYILNYIYNDWYETMCNEEIDCVSVLKEMIDIREGRGTCHAFNIDDGLYIINDFCIN